MHIQTQSVIQCIIIKNFFKGQGSQWTCGEAKNSTVASRYESFEDQVSSLNMKSYSSAPKDTFRLRWSLAV